MKKKGFTLIEILVCIAIVAVLGVSSFVGVRFINNKIKETKLEQIEDRILLAAETYIETNQEVKNKVRDKGAIIPLNVLHNEGLINLDGIIDKNDDDYVIALLGSETPGEECEATYETGSWKIGSKTIYICTKNDGNGGSNLAIIDPASMSNLNKTSREPYYYKGYDANNYIKLKSGDGTIYRIMSVDTDDSITIVNGSFETNLITNSIAIDYYESSNTSFPISKWRWSFEDAGDEVKVSVYVKAKCYSDGSLYSVLSNEEQDYEIRPLATVPSRSKHNCDYTINSSIYVKSKSSGPVQVTGFDYANTMKSASGYSSITYGYSTPGVPGSLSKLRLKSCMKITSGTGAYSTPYILENKC